VYSKLRITGALLATVRETSWQRIWARQTLRSLPTLATRTQRFLFRLLQMKQPEVIQLTVLRLAVRHPLSMVDRRTASQAVSLTTLTDFSRQRVNSRCRFSAHAYLRRFGVSEPHNPSAYRDDNLIDRITSFLEAMSDSVR
jgi:hypothetical protein